jgi:hypothetical protein
MTFLYPLQLAATEKAKMQLCDNMLTGSNRAAREDGSIVQAQWSLLQAKYHHKVTLPGKSPEKRSRKPNFRAEIHLCRKSIQEGQA